MKARIPAVPDRSDEALTPDTAAKDHDLMTIPEAADWLRVSKHWIYFLRHQKKLPFKVVRVGRYLRVRRSELERFLERQTE